MREAGFFLTIYATLGVLFFAGYWLTEGALFCRAGDLIAAFQCLIDKHLSASRTEVGVRRTTTEKRWVPEGRIALVGRIVAAPVEEFAATRLLLYDFATTIRSRTFDTDCF